ncbi:MAG: hypothetical protein J6D37_08770 [Clostridia bacterium]|nr:hypothetical protein [Clostridia bacterium]
MLFKLSFRNMRRQIKNYLIYFITVSLVVALVFSITSVLFSDDFTEWVYFLRKEDIRVIFLLFGSMLCIAVSFFLSYAVSFLLRQRKREFGLYLTLGLTRGQLVLLFAGEMLVLFAFSLGMGYLLGLLLFQGLMAIACNFLEVPAVFFPYNLEGFTMSALLIGAAFLITTLFSLSFLRFAKISKLLHGKERGKRTRIPIAFWGIFCLLTFVCFVVCVIYLCDTLVLCIKSASSESVKNTILWLGAMLISVIFFVFSAVKCLLPLLLKCKKFVSKHLRLFTLRKLSGELTANAGLMSVLSLLLTLSVIFFNGVFAYKQMSLTDIYRRYPVEVASVVEMGEEKISIEEAKKIVEEYAKVDRAIEFVAYMGEGDESDFFREFIYENYGVMQAMEDIFLRESDYQSICEMVGIKPVPLAGGFLFVINGDDRLREAVTSAISDQKLPLGGKEYACSGVVREERHFTLASPQFYNCYFIVIPDEAVEGLREVWQCQYLSVEDVRYDSDSLYDRLSYVDEEWGDRRCDYVLREQKRSFNMELSVIFLLVLTVCAAALVLFAMALLALKALAMLAEDKERNFIAYQVGADEASLRRSLSFQIFFFFCLPFGIPFLLGIPAGVCCLKISAVTGLLNGALGYTALSAFLQAGGIALGLALVFALYFTATYLVSVFDLKRTLTSGT